MSTLSKEKIIEFMKKDLSERLIITPLLNPIEQIDNSGVDIRLGNKFIVTHRTTFPGIDPAQKEKIESKLGEYQTKITINYKEPFVLHPYQLVLGSTLEYIVMPPKLCTYLTSRSTWGRLGQVIATATFIHPCYKGCPTLELINLGEVPIVLYPGLRIGQLIFHTFERQAGEGQAEHSGSYLYAVEPEFSKIHLDEELEFWGPS